MCMLLCTGTLDHIFIIWDLCALRKAKLWPQGKSVTMNLCVDAVLFNIVPQLFDIVAACIFISAALQAWIAVIVFITLGSYIPLTIILTEWRVKFRR